MPVISRSGRSEKDGCLELRTGGHDGDFVHIAKYDHSLATSKGQVTTSGNSYKQIMGLRSIIFGRIDVSYNKILE